MKVEADTVGIEAQGNTECELCVPAVEMNGDSYRLKQSAGSRRAAATAEQNQATADVFDPGTGEITDP